MSDWPKRYDAEVDRDGVIIGLTDEIKGGDWVSSEDFDYLLTYCAEIIHRDPKFQRLSVDQLKDAMLQEIPGWITMKSFKDTINGLV